jgi:hypothetical protein
MDIENGIGQGGPLSMILYIITTLTYLRLQMTTKMRTH